MCGIPRHPSPAHDGAIGAEADGAHAVDGAGCARIPDLSRSWSNSTLPSSKKVRRRSNGSRGSSDSPTASGASDHPNLHQTSPEISNAERDGDVVATELNELFTAYS